MFEGQYLKERLITRRPDGPVHFFFFNDQRDHARPCKLVSFFDRKIRMPGRNHHFAQGIDSHQSFHIHLKKPVRLRKQVDLSFFDGRRNHVFIHAYPAKDVGGFVFMQHPLLLFPNEQVVLSEGKQHGDIFFRHDMPLPECGVFRHALYNLCDIVAQYMPHRLGCVNLFHLIIPA